MWKNRHISDLNAASVQELIRGEIPAVQIGSFADSEELTRLHQALLGQSHRSNSIEQVTRLGISQYAQGLRQTKAHYFQQVPQVVEEFTRIFNNSFDPVARLTGILAELGFDSGVLQEPEFGSYSPCAGKLRNGYSPVHVDFSPQDSAGWRAGESSAQLAWNLYLDLPATGGDLLLWDKQWQSEDDQHQVEDNYYYLETVVADIEPLSIRPREGQLIMLNSRNFHAVSNARNRLAIGSFISYFPPNELRLWI